MHKIPDSKIIASNEGISNKNNIKIQNVQHNGSFIISTAQNRYSTSWKNSEISWADLVRKLSTTARTHETYAEYQKMTKKEQGEIKDVGGFVGGSLKGGRRKADAVGWRQVITLDADFVEGDIWQQVEKVVDYACVMYSTHSHKAEQPKVRLVIPLSRTVTPEEYAATAKRIAADIGIDMFDDTTYQPHRLMYWPSTAYDAEYRFEFLDAAWLDPDIVLAKYDNWRDPLEWPISSRQTKAQQRQADRQGDPHSKPGMVGAFCRMYSIEEAIENFLQDQYTEHSDGRYSYVGGSTAGGLVLYENGKFAYSHHGTDPISGLLVNAFDLVRLHKFGFQDEEAKEGTPVNRLPSSVAMAELVRRDERIKRQQIEEDFADDPIFKETGLDWLGKLERDERTGKIQANSFNVKYILKHDPHLSNKFARDAFSYKDVLVGDVPWRDVAKHEALDDDDDAGLRNYLSETYGITGKSVIEDAFAETLLHNEFHPVRNYLESLTWDGVPRVDQLFIKYLGANDTELIRAMTRKTLVGAVARIFKPGCKFDYVLMLVGAQGIGKSSLIALLGGEWFTDSLEDVRGKDSYEQIQGSWIIELGELAALRKADVEAVKRFVSTQSDKFRQAYAKRSREFPRQCIFIASTNVDDPLKDSTGNRRFWPVQVGIHPVDLAERMNFPRDQIWAEAVQRYKEKEPLMLPTHLEDQAKVLQGEYTEESSYAGLIRGRLDEPWEEEPFKDEDGSGIRNRVCALEVWTELLGFPRDKFTNAKAKEINAILKNTPGWKVYPNNKGKARHGAYGIQLVYDRVTAVTADFLD